MRANVKPKFESESRVVVVGQKVKVYCFECTQAFPLAGTAVLNLTTIHNTLEIYNRKK